MIALSPNEKIVAVGTFLYAGTYECDLRIVFSSVRYGSGDYEDDPEIADDLVAETYYVQYGSTTQRGVFNSRSAGYSSLAEARSAAQAASGIGPTVRWLSGAV